MSRAPIIEKDLCFDFGPRWTTVIQWERCSTFREGMRYSPEPHTMDVIAVLEGKIAYFIEVKDYWARSRSSEKRSIADELDLKVRATVASMLGAYRRSRRPDSNPDDARCAAVYAALLGNAKPRVVLWYEAPLSELVLEKNQQKRGKVAANAAMGRLRDLRWLDVRPASVGQSDTQEEREAVLPGVKVQRLGSERRKKVEKICEDLKARFPSGPDEVLWHVEDCLDPAELDEIAKRAATLRDSRELLRPRR
jgi:hypothetical protein